MKTLIALLIALVALPAQIASAQSQPTIYWTDSKAGKIQSMNLADGTTEDLLAATLRFPQDIAVDLDGGKMYWISPGTDFDGKIRRANLDGSAIEDLVENDRPQGLALDATSGWIYWVGDGDLQRIKLDGSGQEVVRDSVTWPLANDSFWGIALDLDRGKVYWSSFSSGNTHAGGKIERADFDGSGHEIILSGLGYPGDLVLDSGGGRMYWTDISAVTNINQSRTVPCHLLSTCLMSATLDGSDQQVLIDRIDSLGLFHLDVALDSDQNKIYLGVGGPWRIPWGADGPWPTTIVYRYDLTNSELEALPTGGNHFPDGIEVTGDHLYWADQVHGSIHRSNLDFAEVRDLITSPAVDPQHIDVDLEDGKIYWTESRWIRRANLDGTGVENLVLAVGGPWAWEYGPWITDFALDLKNRKMYWSRGGGAWGPDVGGIYRSNLDGSDLDNPYKHREVSALALDPDADQMYIADGYIRHAKLDGSFDGSFAESLILEPAHALALDAENDMLYYASGAEIRRATLDGTHVDGPVLVSGLNLVKSLALDLVDGKIYWTQSSRHDTQGLVLSPSRIRRANLDGSDVEDILVSEEAEYMDVFVSSESSKSTAVTYEQPAGFNLHAAYPNPFNPATTIRYSLGSSEHITVKVRDALGRIVAVLVDDARPAGTHQVIWSAGRDQPSGVYFYTLEKESGAVTRSMMLLK